MADSALRRLLRALLLAAERPLEPVVIADLIAQAVDEEEWPAKADAAAVTAELTTMRADELDGRTGIELIEVAGGWRLRTATDLAPMVRRLWPDKRVRLSKAALEALSIVAYRQPCTRIDIEDIRGVDSGGVLRSLLERKLIRILGRQDEPGRPLLYGTTSTFLETFSLPGLTSLPTLRDLESLRLEEAVRARGEPSAAEPADESD
ncbi:MAG: SMC-Scp complex subunit ScpB [Myxococcales bacterium]|nr:SMC-Scp complex subunit ScpB [Myxococcales bacterium]